MNENTETHTDARTNKHAHTHTFIDRVLTHTFIDRVLTHTHTRTHPLKLIIFIKDNRDADEITLDIPDRR